MEIFVSLFGRVDGMLLSTLSDEEFETEPGLTKLQARKIRTRLPP